MNTTTLLTQSTVIPMFQPRRAAFWVFCLAVVGGVYSTITMMRFGWSVMPVSIAAGLIAWALHGFWNSPLLSSLLEDAGALGLVSFFVLKGMPILIAVVLLWRVARREGVHGN